MRVSVVGLGYVGLVSAVGLASWGHRVRGADVDPKRVQALRRGMPPFFEPGMEPLLTQGIAEDRLTFSHDPAGAAADAEVVIVAVGTHDGAGGWQTATVMECLQAIVPGMADDAVLVVRSTLPPEFLSLLPGAVDQLRQEAGCLPIPVMLNPEFTREGSAIRDFLVPERVLIGTVTDPDGAGAARLRELYAQVEAPIIELPATDAALAKLGSNLFLATKISFANELARICDAYGGTVDEVVRVMGLDPRIGGRFLRPGVGFGGSCLPHQVSMTVRSASAHGIDLPLLAAVETVNEQQLDLGIEKLQRYLGGDLLHCRIALFGLTFKPETDDLREAPALAIAERLVELGAHVVAYDPSARARRLAADLVPGLGVVDSPLEAADSADAVALVTEWRVFLDLDWTSVASVMRGQLVLDGRNALDAATIRAAGLLYAAFGRPSDDPSMGAVRRRAAVADDRADARDRVLGEAERVDVDAPSTRVDRREEALTGAGGRR